VEVLEIEDLVGFVEIDFEGDAGAVVELAQHDRV
jgi:hypothetical protein